MSIDRMLKKNNGWTRIRWTSSGNKRALISTPSEQSGEKISSAEDIKDIRM